jgi:hypothetical protein
MSKPQPTVAELFQRAQALRQENPGGTYVDLARALMLEYREAEFPSPDKLTIPEQDARAPEEDWTAGLPLVLRGIQQKNWAEITRGIVLCLEQTEGYEKSHGSAREDWRDRSKGIGGHASQSVGKWLPDELAALARRKGWR